ncbi:adenylyltransferase/cytidyltransferase family protein [Oscillospiraceae bacterium N12]|jgi:glycerol-3-phosphate cytidylyltransferase|uniref:Adenylyltransferase/cytidyltransferase family protein n=1 Tax=Jilunia laotingensis TaxID=2763675 RepID=A0A926F529_9BACT|nr:adenylyltransferase/cytidyltransferase family protein [Jilunia laotingensis]MBC8594851.1 adenylyltransferase/cytidyltransferase family protein [Jilunia laotingensis]
MINIYVIGVFDLFHTGHVELLKRAKALGDRLIVAINSDRIVESYKRKPYISERDRLAVVEACRYVDEAFVIDTFDNKEAIVKNNINIIVHGSDWAGEGYMKQIRVDQAFLDNHGVSMVFLPYTQGISTSQILESIKKSM